jgi:hypothetical protein
LLPFHIFFACQLICSLCILKLVLQLVENSACGGYEKYKEQSTHLDPKIQSFKDRLVDQLQSSPEQGLINYILDVAGMNLNHCIDILSIPEIFS